MQEFSALPRNSKTLNFLEQNEHEQNDSNQIDFGGFGANIASIGK